ncbi:hypothetical protein SCHPADRAFT_837752 [Schizopora paradoxa]|uniref:GST N-terminal domain-containing protein n=1 Tax=Schizopora paradoxa TaxID=27342 RepID=A0A0H2RAX1_9AGAM|nr:hypothetical protein SCHPADRAFT_837752 [Schizopora paradoxa]
MTNGVDTGKHYHKSCTGDALVTVQKHSTTEDITFFAACFCPFVQRVWIALEYLQIPYQVSPHVSVDPYKKPKELLEVSPKGLVPGLKLNNFNPPKALNESTVILEYVEDTDLHAQIEASLANSERSLLPPKKDPYARALVRLQCDHVNRSLVPAFYRFLQAQDQEQSIAAGKDFLESLDGLAGLLLRAERESQDPVALGLWHENGSLNLTDAMAGPWLFRASNVLKHYRGFELPENERFNRWLLRLFNHASFKATCSTEELYLDSYERWYAFNRPNTSQVANAINSGRNLP